MCNPTSNDELARLVGLLRLPAAARVVDIACGNGEFLICLAKAYGIRGIGIDISPFCIADAQRQVQMRAQGAEVVFSQMDGSDFRPEEPRIFTLWPPASAPAGCSVVTPRLWTRSRAWSRLMVGPADEAALLAAIAEADNGDLLDAGEIMGGHDDRGKKAHREHG